MIRSFDADLLDNAIQPYRDIVGDFNSEEWLADRRNFMYENDESVGLATHEYPGVYSVHWFFNHDARGRKAIDLARAMLKCLFEDSDAVTIRGLTRKDLRGARWASRKVGMVYQGDITIGDHDYEIFTMTKKDF